MSSLPRREYWAEAKKRSRKKLGKTHGYLQHLAVKGIFITPDEYVRLLDGQDGKCVICEQEFVGRPHLDHDHKTGKVRGFLCGLCNSGLGMFRDSPELMVKAIAYLKRSQ